jgi:hypothetical protein
LLGRDVHGNNQRAILEVRGGRPGPRQHLWWGVLLVCGERTTHCAAGLQME